MRIYLKDKKGVIKTDSHSGISLEECDLLWIDSLNHSKDELQEIGKLIGAEELALKQLVKEEGPKVQEYPNHLFIIWNFLRDNPDTEKIETSSLGIFWGKNYIVTIHFEELPELDSIYQKLEIDPSIYREQPGLIVYSIMDSAVDEYFPLVESLTENIDSYMENLLTENKSGDLKELLRLKHRNMAVRKAVASHRDLVIKLARRDKPFIPDELSVYVMDIYDHFVRIGSEIENNAELISASLDIHLNLESNRLNVTMKRLATIALIFMPMTFLVGLYGMNFKYMPELAWRYGYLAAWLLIIVITTLMIIIAKRKEWF